MAFWEGCPPIQGLLCARPVLRDPEGETGLLGAQRRAGLRCLNPISVLQGGEILKRRERPVGVKAGKAPPRRCLPVSGMLWQEMTRSGRKEGGEEMGENEREVYWSPYSRGTPWGPGFFP